MSKGRALSGKRLRQRNHAIQRCSQRYGVDLTLAQYVQLCDRIWSFLHGAECNGVERAPGSSQARFFVWYQRTPMLVMWNEDTSQITTFLSRADRIVDRERIVRIRSTPIRHRWKMLRAGAL